MAWGDDDALLLLLAGAIDAHSKCAVVLIWVAQIAYKFRQASLGAKLSSGKLLLSIVDLQCWYG